MLTDETGMFVTVMVALALCPPADAVILVVPWTLRRHSCRLEARGTHVRKVGASECQLTASDTDPNLPCTVAVMRHCIRDQQRGAGKVEDTSATSDGASVLDPQELSNTARPTPSADGSHRLCS